MEKDRPEEVACLEAFGKFPERVQRLLGEIPHGTVELLHRVLTQEGGRLSKRAPENEFSMLTEDEGDAVEEIWRECHERSEGPSRVRCTEGRQRIGFAIEPEG